MAGEWTKSDDGVKDLYPSERKACQGIMYALRLKHCFRRQGESTQSQPVVANLDGVPVCDSEIRMMKAFETEARNRFAEIGLVLGGVQWEPDVSDDPNDKSIYWNPRPIISARTDKIPEIDHDRMKHEIQGGLLDGRVGVIDPNDPAGGLKDPKRKNIY
jgi:hypothetical protein